MNIVNIITSEVKSAHGLTRNVKYGKLIIKVDNVNMWGAWYTGIRKGNIKT